MTGKFARFAFLVLFVWTLTGFMSSGICQGATPGEVTPIHEDSMPSIAGAWFTGVILSIGGILVGIKNSKRTHLD